MVRVWAIRVGFAAGVLGLIGSLTVQLAAFWWHDLARYAPAWHMGNVALLGIAGLALLLVLLPRGGATAAPAWQGEATRALHRRLGVAPPTRWTRRDVARLLVREWPLVVLIGLFVHLLVNLGLGNHADPASVFWQLYLLRVQSTSWMILYFVPVAVVGSHVLRRR
jgi:hypothetical protein